MEIPDSYSGVLGQCQQAWVPEQDSHSLTHSWNFVDANSLGVKVNEIWLEQAVPALHLTHRAG